MNSLQFCLRSAANWTICRVCNICAKDDRLYCGLMNGEYRARFIAALDMWRISVDAGKRCCYPLFERCVLWLNGKVREGGTDGVRNGASIWRHHDQPATSGLTQGVQHLLIGLEVMRVEAVP